VLLVIDEAQNLSFAALEELRMLSNLETEKSKLLEIVLVGQPNLRDKLAAPELEQLRQRITVSYHLCPLDADEAANYVNHRLRRAALGAPLEFPREVTDVIHQRSRGVPRIINVICDAALVFGYAEERRQIDLPLMHEVMGELEATGVLPAVAAPARETVSERAPVAPVPDAPMAPVQAVAPRAMPTPQAIPAMAPVPAAPAALRAPEPALVVPAVARAAAAEGRDAALDQREQAIRQRERELADQRRVLAEEYRLLRMQRATPPLTTPTPAITAATPAVRVHVARPTMPARFESVRHESAWGRIKRFLLGLAAPAVEEN